jgi:predicted nucleic acid-binding protein
MAGPGVFLDTSGLIALLAQGDKFHQLAIARRDELGANLEPFVTSDLVLSEFLAWGARPPVRSRVIGVVLSLRQSPHALVVPASRETWDRAFELYQARADKAWSIVDCDSVLTCQGQGIKRVFTADHHFSQAGLEVMLK